MDNYELPGCVLPIPRWLSISLLSIKMLLQPSFKGDQANKGCGTHVCPQSDSRHGAVGLSSRDDVPLSRGSSRDLVEIIRVMSDGRLLE